MLNRKRTVRLTMASALVPVVVGMSTACGIPVVPVTPNEQPMSLTVRDGAVWLQWCGEETEEFGYLAIDYATYRDGVRTSERAAEGSGSFRFTPRLVFSSTLAPPGVEFAHSEPIPVADVRTLVFVYPGAAADDLSSQRVVFDIDSFTSLEEGTWLYPSGDVATEPCGMRGAVDGG